MSAKQVSVVIIAACFVLVRAAGHQELQWKGKIEEEEGVKVIKNPKEPLYGEITLDLEEDLTIGNDADERYMFFRGVSSAVDSEQNIYVGDSGNFRIQKFDKHGNYLQTIGKKGQGPGEFEILSGIYVDSEDNLYVKGFQRISIFDKNSKLRSTIPLGTILNRWAITEDGNILGVTYTYGSYERSELKKNVVLINSQGVPIKTIASFLSEYGAFMIDGTALGAYNSYAPMLHLLPLNGNRSIYAWSPDFRLYVIDSTGDLLLIIDKDEPREKISQKEKMQVIEDEISLVKRTKRITLSESKVAKKYKFPDFKPLVTSILTDDLGNIYVFKFDREFIEKKELKYDFFNKEGFYLYRVNIPSIISFFIKNGCVYSTEYDRETGYARIKRYRIKNWDQIRKGARPFNRNQ